MWLCELMLIGLALPASAAGELPAAAPLGYTGAEQ
jgi:hypothetical protein